MIRTINISSPPIGIMEASFLSYVRCVTAYSLATGSASTAGRVGGHLDATLPLIDEDRRRRPASLESAASVK
jgi:hypothetical protein